MSSGDRAKAPALRRAAARRAVWLRRTVGATTAAAIVTVVSACAGHVESSKAVPPRRMSAASMPAVSGAPTSTTTTSSPSLPPSVNPSAALQAIRYGPEPHQLLDLELPDHARYPAPVPVIMYLHGGAWASGTRADVSAAAVTQIGRGYAVASVEYQLGGRGTDGQPLGAFPGAVWDVKRAIRFLKANAGDWGLDPAEIILMGSSAGGHLAALVGASAGALEPVVDASLASVDSSVTAIVDLAGITDLAAFAMQDDASAALVAALLGCSPSADGRARCSSDLLFQASVAPYVDASDPPILMVYGALDELAVPVTQGQPLAEAWEKTHDGDEQSTTYSVIPDVGHDVEEHIDMARLSEFLDRTTGGAALAGRRVILYGDSLSWEAQGAFRDAVLAAGLGDVMTRTFGGTAICDWLDLMRSDQQQLHPAAVVVEFSGNAFTPCMKDSAGVPLSGAALLQKYGDDAVAVLKIFDQDATLVYFASAPISLRAEQAQDPQPSRLNAMYASVSASDSFAHFVDAGTAVEDHGHWTGVLPCLTGEPCDGGVGPSGQPVNVVRAPDGIHFCPGAPGAVQGVTGSCLVWSSGAYRYGVAMADPIPRDLSYARASERES